MQCSSLTCRARGQYHLRGLPLSSFSLLLTDCTSQQIVKKNKLELQKNENHRNTRIQLEKQLQASIEGHITRTVESYTYTIGESDGGGIGSNAVFVNAKLLLLHTFERIRITNGKKSFKRFLLSELSSSLFEEMVWLSFCHFFQKVRLVARTLRYCLPSVHTDALPCAAPQR